LPLQRCELQGRGITVRGLVTLCFLETWIHVQRFRAAKLESLFGFSPLPVRAFPFPGGAFGFVLRCVDVGFEPAATPLVAFSLSSKLYNYPSTAAACASDCTSREVLSPSALDSPRRPYDPVDPSTGTVRLQRFSRSCRLAPPKTMQGLFHPHCAPGVPADLGGSHGGFPPAGPTRPRFLFAAFSSPVMGAFWRVLPSCASPSRTTNSFGARRR